MSIEKEYGKYVPFCDCCGTELEPVESFDEAVEIMDTDEWIRRRIDGEWMVFCSDCREEFEVT